MHQIPYRRVTALSLTDVHWRVATSFMQKSHIY